MNHHRTAIFNSIKNVIPFTILIFLGTTTLPAQTVFHTADISHFFQAYDSVQATTDKQQQIAVVQKIYLDQGSLGVQYAMGHSVDGGALATAKHWVDFMQHNKAYLDQIRPYFSNLPAQMAILETQFQYFKAQYPPFKDGNVYFVVGLGMFGGRPEGNHLFIGCERLASEQPDWAVNIVLHEFVHTLQHKSDDALLAHCLNEGAADFIAEIISQRSLREVYPNSYIDFGYRNEKAVWTDFKKYVASHEKGVYFDWLYGTKGRQINGVAMKDLGYFVGYKICKSYYDRAADKQQAIKDIIEMDVSTDEKARAFLIKSGYVPERDRKFVQTFTFKKVVDQKKGVKLVRYGYRTQKDHIEFQFELPPSIPKEQVEFITIAGSFNGWNPKDLNYRMNHTKDNKYTYVLPKSKLADHHHEFKFVINGESWQPVPENARNTQNGNLTLEIK